MEEKSFREMLQKYLMGELSEEEENMLYEFEVHMLSKNRNTAFRDEADKQQVQQDIQKEIILRLHLRQS